MRIKQIEKMIREAVAEEKRSGRFAKLVETAARQRGANPTGDAVQGLVRFAREYVEHVPLLMQQGASAAKEAGLDAEMGQMLRELESYWFEANDLLPDHLGLLGLLDDAYGTLFLLQAFSDHHQATCGRPLLRASLTSANQVIRVIIGDPVVSILEQRVAVTLANVMMQRLLGGFANAGFSLPAGPDPIWGNASINDIVDARLGAMGIFR